MAISIEDMRAAASSVAQEQKMASIEGAGGTISPTPSTTPQGTPDNSSPTQNQSNPSGSSAFMAGVSGFNQGVEDLVVGSEQLVQNGINKVFGTNFKGIDDYEQAKLKEFDKIAAEHPLAATGGRVVGNIAASAPLSMIGGASTTVGRIGLNAAQGAAMGGLQYTDEGLAGNVKNAALGGALGGAVSGAVETVSHIPQAARLMQKGWQLRFQDANDVFDNTMQTITKEVGGDLSKASYQSLEKVVGQTKSQLKTTTNELYALRDTVANQAGVTVGRSNLAKVVKETGEDVFTTTGQAAEKRATNYLGNGNNVTFTQAFKQMKDAYQNSYKSSLSNPTKGMALKQIGDAIKQDIEEAAFSSGNPELLQLHNAANKYYSSVYKPFSDAANKMDNIADRFTNEKYISSMFNFLKTDANARTLVQSIPNEAKRNLELAHVLALKEASVKNGQFDFSAYATRLNQEAAKNPTLFGNSTSLIKGLADVLEAKGIAQSATAVPKLNIEGIGAAGAVASAFFNGPAAIALGGAVVSKRAYMLAKAGGMLNKAEGRLALEQWVKVQSSGAAQQVKDAIADRVVKIFNSAAIGGVSRLKQPQAPSDNNESSY